MQPFDAQERRDFVDEHIAHRLTALLSVIRRQPAHPNFFTGRSDVYRASIEGSYLMLRVFIEFLGVESARHDGKLALAKRGNLRWHSIGAFQASKAFNYCVGKSAMKLNSSPSWYLIRWMLSANFGEDYEAAVVPEKARAVLSHFDERSQH